MAHPTTRVLAVLELLQTHGLLSGAEIARRLGVDGRTVRRYVVRLEELGIPITTERGREGGYQLVPGFKLPPMMFNDDEALALSVGLLAARGLGLGEAAPGVASAQAKLERVMPASFRHRVRAAEETITLDLPARRAAATAGAGVSLAALTAAAQSRRRVHLRYRAASGGESARDFDPYGLAYRGGCWYAVGHCHLRRGLRSFRLDRVLSVRRLETVFERPEGFDALGYLTFSVATLPRTFAVEVLVEAELAAVEAAVFETLGILEPTPEGVVLRGQTDDLDWMARELARLPFGFQIRRPAELAQALRRHAERLALTANRDPAARTTNRNGPPGTTASNG